MVARNKFIKIIKNEMTGHMNNLLSGAKEYNTSKMAYSYNTKKITERTKFSDLKTTPEQQALLQAATVYASEKPFPHMSLKQAKKSLKKDFNYNKDDLKMLVANWDKRAGAFRKDFKLKVL